MELQKKKKYPISYESIEHSFAKYKYAEILEPDWIRVEVEHVISRDGWYYFIPDIAVYDSDGVAGFYEIVFTHDVDLPKMQKIWTFAQDCDRPLFIRTITAENVINDNYQFLLDITI